nr:sodium:hydrogen exchanger 2 (nhe2) [Hymenolepis microstoma]
MGNGNSTLSEYNDSCSKLEVLRTGSEHIEIALAGFKLEELTIYLTVTLFIMVIMLLKIGYQKVPHIGSYFPESLLLMLVGLAFGAIIRYTNSKCAFNALRLSPHLFFNILLPPIMLESAYNIYNKKFAEILSTILFFAGIGTVLNFLFIGLGLYVVDISIGLGEPNLHFGIKEFLLFASLIVAVDPVAVLAIFQDIGVDLNLYYMVFGESLLNDAVTVVLYNIMSALVMTPKINGWQIATGIGSFFTVSFGGALIGLIHGVFCCFLTRFGTGSETLGVILTSYLSYIIADLFAWSGIISIIVCGVVQSAYAFHNLSPLSIMVLESAIGQVAAISEAVIFLLLGSEVFALNLRWHTGFLITSLVLCIVGRFFVIMVLSAIVNKNRCKSSRISWSEQVIISYGGLRGAVAFALAILIQDESTGDGSQLARDVQVTTAIAVIFFTVAIMGTTMKPLVRLLNIRLHSEKDTNKNLLLTLNDSVMEDTLIFVEELISSRGVHSLVRALTDFDDKYIRPILQRDAATHEMKIVNAYEKLALQMHSEAIGAPRDSTARIEPESGTCTDIPGIPSMLMTQNLPSSRYQRRLTLAALTSIGPEVALLHSKNSDFASAQRAQFAKLNRNQASFARTMDMQIRHHDTGSADELRRRHSRGHRGHLIRQFANCDNSDTVTAGRHHAVRFAVNKNKLTIPTINVSSIDSIQNAIDEEDKHPRRSKTTKSMSVDL